MFLQLIFLVLVASVSCSEDEDRLFRHILNGANPNSRPVRKSSSPVSVSLELWIHTIKNFDEHNQALQVIGILNKYWVDEYISWNPKDYGGVSNIVVPLKNLWAPNMKLAPGYFTSEGYDRVTVASNGGVFHDVQAMFTTSCAYQTTKTKACQLAFSPWPYNAKQVKLTAKDAKMPPGLFLKHKDWSITNLTTAAHEMEYPCCPGTPYGDVTVYLELTK